MLPAGVWQGRRGTANNRQAEKGRFAMPQTASSPQGWTPAAGPLVNEMLLHDVYDLPYDVLRSALYGRNPRIVECPCCGGNGDDHDSIRHAGDCSFIGTVSHL
jgi:hypothetical protein